uniref:DUF4218 domain-containing protein n=1 Tax=Solanum lycopersicum TaxID=4081 RepID=A0A3Q7JV53_SOLLC
METNHIDFCYGKLFKSSFDRMKENIIVITTKLEKIFPCGLFDVMEHLPIHLVQEVRLGGPVQTRLIGHASTHALEKLSRLESVIGLPKLKFEKDHVKRESIYYITPIHNDHGDTIQAKSTTLVDKGNIPREWRHNAYYPENFILGKPDDKIQTRSSIRKQASLDLV